MNSYQSRCPNENVFCLNWSAFLESGAYGCLHISSLLTASIISSVKASKLYDDGCRSLKDMHKPKYLSTLSHPIRVALQYVDHLDKRISRAQIDTLVVCYIDLKHSPVNSVIILGANTRKSRSRIENPYCWEPVRSTNIWISSFSWCSYISQPSWESNELRDKAYCIPSFLCIRTQPGWKNH